MKQSTQIPITPSASTTSAPMPGAKSLLDASHGVWHRIQSLIGPHEACDRLLDLGFTPGEEVRVVQTTPLGDPLVVILRGSRLALRRQEAAWITVL